jgi:hypothetical protein
MWADDVSCDPNIEKRNMLHININSGFYTFFLSLHLFFFEFFFLVHIHNYEKKDV